ncbi:MAG: T9SS type A sorting domain-containing protein [Bacteroidota bacterium]|nr:T9SS type A sorting domain-containing protein [Bacteroidota bacterium]
MLQPMLLMTVIGHTQIIFPEGHEKKITSSHTVLYEETKIPFINRGGKITDLRWQRISDSIPPDWFIMACMNGTCLGGVPESGRFDNFLNNADSIGFLKYHFDFNGMPGTAIIRFLIFNDLMIGSNTDTATFNITYVAPNALAYSSEPAQLTAYPNPSTDFWTIGGIDITSIISAKITDVLGHIIAIELPIIPVNNLSCRIYNTSLTPGIYFLKLSRPNFSQILQLIKQ